MKRLVYLLTLLIFIPQLSHGQTKEKGKLIQVNGFITDDQKSPVPHVSIYSHKLRRGTISEYSGIYSLISIPGDTVYISALGYKRQEFTVPLEVDGKYYKQDVSLVSDTISIEGVTIFPWRNYEEFKREVLASIPEEKQEIKNMYANLANIQASIANRQAYAVSPEAGYRLYMQQNANMLMTRNQTPYNNLLNPFAWAKFFNGVKHGLLKNQKSTQAEKTRNKSKKKKETVKESDK
ncbi:MAG: carboxypeptidase-like regulatory domain-containing protein [Bacteroidales bacterium]